MIHVGWYELTCVVDGNLHAILHVRPEWREKLKGWTAVSCWQLFGHGSKLYGIEMRPCGGMFSPIMDFDQEVVVADCRFLGNAEFTEHDMQAALTEFKQQRDRYLPPVVVEGPDFVYPELSVKS